MNTETRVEDIAVALGLTVDRRLTGGAFGALSVRTAAGAPAVLKMLPTDGFWSEPRVRAALELAESLRSNGYPAPRYLDVGVVSDRVYTLQEMVNGAAPEVLQPEHVQTMIDLRLRQVGTASPDPTWAEEVVASIRANDGEGQGLLRFTGTPEVIELLEEALVMGERIDAAIFSNSDVVHNDFGAHNVLVRGGRVIAVVDWEGARVGDSRADLATFAWYTLPVTKDPGVTALLEAEIDSWPVDVAAALAARFAISKIYFALRSGDDVLLSWTVGVVDRWLRPRWRALRNS